MAQQLEGMKVAFVVANEGIEQVELTEPWKAVEAAGGQPVLVAPKPGSVQAFNHLDKADTFPVDVTTGDAKLDDYAGVVLPGGVANPDQLRTDRAAVDLVGEAFRRGVPIAAICHGPWTLIETGQLSGRTLTSWPSLQTDLATPAPRGSTRRSSSTTASSAAGTPTTCRRSARSSSRSWPRASTAGRRRRDWRQ